MKMYALFFVVSLYISRLDGKGVDVIDICDLQKIKTVLNEKGVVTVRTPSSSEKDACKPTFEVPPNYTFDVSLVSSGVPKKSPGTQEKCINVEFPGQNRELDCSTDSSGFFTMASNKQVIYRNKPRATSAQAVIHVPLWNTDWKFMLQLNEPSKSTWSLDSSVTRVVAEGAETTFRCPHPNERLIPRILFDDKLAEGTNSLLHRLNVKKSESGLYTCDFGDTKDNKVKAISDVQRMVVAERTLLARADLTHENKIVNASADDVHDLYCSAKLFVGSMKGITSSEWDNINAILAEINRGDSKRPPWLSLDRLSWIDLTDETNPFRLIDVTGNLTFHTNADPGARAGGDLIFVPDIQNSYFEMTSIATIVIKDDHEGRTLHYRCAYNDENAGVGGSIAPGYIQVHVPTVPSIIDLLSEKFSPAIIATIVIVSVTFILLVVGIACCCVRGLPGRGKNVMRDDNPLAGTNGWTVRAEPTTPTQDGVLFQPRGPSPRGIDDDNSGPSNGEVVFVSSSPPLPSPNADGAPFSSGRHKWSPLSQSESDTEGDHDVSLSNDTYGVVYRPPNAVVVAT